MCTLGSDVLDRDPLTVLILSRDLTEAVDIMGVREEVRRELR